LNLYRFNSNSAKILELIVEATIKGEKVPTQKDISKKVGISTAEVSKIISDLCELEEYDNCPYLEKNGQKIKLAYPEQLLRESKGAEVLFTIKEIANKNGYFDVSQLRIRLSREQKEKSRFNYTGEDIDKIVSDLESMEILEKKGGNPWRIILPLFNAEKEYLKLVLAADPYWELYPTPRKKRQIAANILHGNKERRINQ